MRHALIFWITIHIICKVVDRGMKAVFQFLAKQFSQKLSVNITISIYLDTLKQFETFPTKQVVKMCKRRTAICLYEESPEIKTKQVRRKKGALGGASPSF